MRNRASYTKRYYHRLFATLCQLFALLLVAALGNASLLISSPLAAAHLEPVRNNRNAPADQNPFSLPALEKEDRPSRAEKEEQPPKEIEEEQLEEDQSPTKQPAVPAKEEKSRPLPAEKKEQDQPPEEQPAVPAKEEKNLPPPVEWKEPRPAPPERQWPDTQTTKLGAESEAALLSNIRQVTFVGQRAGEGYFSQDGSLLIFQSEREPGNPFFQIYLLDLRTGDIRRISPGVGKTTCPWISPNKKKALFASTHLDPTAREQQKAELEKRASGQGRRYAWDFDEQYEIFETDLTGGQAKNLTKARGYDAEGSWSPDGSLIVFASNRHAYTQKLSAEEQASFARDPSSQVDIYLMKADGTQVRRLTTTPGYDGGPFFSADGKKICWRHFSLDGTTAEIFTMNVDGSEPRQLTHLGAMSWAPYFHPSGDYLIFATNLQGMKNFELYLVDAEGTSTPVRVTFADGFDGLPAFSPDGKQLAWTSARDANKQSQIFIAEWNDEAARRLLKLPPITQPAATEDATAPALPTPDQTPAGPSISAESLRIHLTALASEKMEGRLTGTAGERRAAEYVASVFQWLGLTPAGDNGTFFQTFQFTAGVSLGADNDLLLRSERGEHEYSVDKDWRPLAFSKPGSFAPSEVVFAGYGIVAPAADGYGAYDAFAHLDVADKWVMVLRYLPEGIAPELRQHLNRYASLRYKAMAARDRGARGVIVVSGPNAQVKEQLVPLSFDASLAVTSVGAITVSDALAERLLESSGKTLKDLQTELDTGKPVPGFALPEVELEVTVDIEQAKRTGRNVLARLGAGAGAGKGAVVVGAHLDHLGRGEGAGSLARADEKGQIHYGADDNASGVAGMLEIAQALSEAKAKGGLRLQRDIIFAAWSGEEEGLLGSSHFVRTFGRGQTEPTTLAPGIIAYLNMDMIGRLNKAVVLQGVSSSSVWLKEIERAAAQVGLAVTPQGESYLPTDSTSFYLKGVPTVNAFTGAHADYHTPRDTADKVNSEGAAKIAQLLMLLTRSLATRTDAPDFVAATKPPSSLGRVNLRAYLGTIPDYTPGDLVGVKLSGVVKSGPADQAGVQSGDVIVELAGKKVDNIYDYTYALDGLKIGVPVDLTILRRNQRLKLQVTPGSRE